MIRVQTKKKKRVFYGKVTYKQRFLRKGYSSVVWCVTFFKKLQ